MIFLEECQVARGNIMILIGFAELSRRYKCSVAKSTGNSIMIECHPATISQRSYPMPCESSCAMRGTLRICRWERWPADPD